jgi:hypothetical protein
MLYPLSYEGAADAQGLVHLPRLGYKPARIRLPTV